MLLPLTPEVNVIIGFIYVSGSFAAFRRYRPRPDADVTWRVVDGEPANAQADFFFPKFRCHEVTSMFMNS